MDPGDNDEPSREELESRVDQLEQTVSKMLPDRRGVLKGLGAAAIGGAAVGGATGGASGQSAAGQVGTESEPVDVEAAQGNFNSVSAEESLTTPRTITLNVPTDYATVGDALDRIRQIRASPGLLFAVNIESGHQWQKQVWVDSEDLGHVTITSEDATVQADTSGAHDNASFRIEPDAIGPTWDILLDGQGIDTNGIRVRRNSRLYINENKGVQNFGQNGLDLAFQNFVYAENAISRDNGGRGINSSNQSLVYATRADITNNTGEGVRAEGGLTYLQDATVSGNRTNILAENARVTALNVDATNASEAGIFADDGSIIRAGGADVSNAASIGVRCRLSSTVDFNSGTADSCNSGLVVNINGKIGATGATITNSTDDGLTARDGAYVELSNGEISGSGAIDIELNTGSIVNANACVTTDSTGSDPHVNDINVSANNVTKDGIVFAVVES